MAKAGRKIRTKVVGVTFPNPDGTSRQDIIKRCCRKHSELLARREPTNRFDPNAIGLWVADGNKYRLIGYVSAELAEDLADVADAGGALKVKVLNVTGGWKNSRGVNLEIRTEKGALPAVEARGFRIAGFVLRMAGAAIVLVFSAVASGVYKAAARKKLDSRATVVRPGSGCEGSMEESGSGGGMLNFAGRVKTHGKDSLDWAGRLTVLRDLVMTAFFAVATFPTSWLHRLVPLYYLPLSATIVSLIWTVGKIIYMTRQLRIEAEEKGLERESTAVGAPEALKNVENGLGCAWAFKVLNEQMKTAPKPICPACQMELPLPLSARRSDGFLRCDNKGCNYSVRMDGSKAQILDKGRRYFERYYERAY